MENISFIENDPSSPASSVETMDWDYFEYRWSTPHAEYLRTEFGLDEYLAELNRRKSQFEEEQNWVLRKQMKKLKRKETDLPCGFLNKLFKKIRRALKDAYTCPPHLQ